MAADTEKEQQDLDAIRKKMKETLDAISVHAINQLRGFDHEIHVEDTGVFGPVSEESIKF